MPSLAWQVKSDAVCLVDAGTGEGFAVGVYDTGSADHQCDLYVDQFPLPTGASAATALSCAVRTSPNPPFTGYTASWQRNADSSCQIDIYSWTAGAHTSGVAAPLSSTLGVPTPVAGDKFSFWAAGSTLSVFINDTKVVSTTDSTNLTGTFGGIHEWRNTTTAEARIAKFAAYAKAAPPTPPPPGGGPGTRHAPWWPGAVNNAFNVSFGDGVTFGSTAPSSGTDPVHSLRYGITVENGLDAGWTYPVAQQIDQHTAALYENHKSVIQSGGITTIDQYGAPEFNTYWQSAPYTLTGGLVWVGTGAAKFGHIYGAVRKFDMDQGVIRHALQFFLTNGDLTLTPASGYSTPYTWPAFGVDSNAYAGCGNGGYCSGVYHIGDRLGIPWGTTKPALSPQGSMIWDALMVYGGIVSNRAGNTSIIVEALPGDSWAQALRNSGDMTARILPACRRATNITSSNIAGPVTVARRGPDAPGTFV